jgi:hypothetical protein
MRSKSSRIDSGVCLERLIASSSSVADAPGGGPDLFLRRELAYDAQEFVGVYGLRDVD